MERVTGSSLEWREHQYYRVIPMLAEKTRRKREVGGRYFFFYQITISAEFRNRDMTQAGGR